MRLNQWSLDQLLTVMGGTALIAIFVSLGMYVTVSVTSLQENALSQRGQGITTLLAQELVRPMLLGDRLALHDILVKASRTAPELRYFCVLNARGQPVAHTFTAGCPRALLGLWSTGSGPLLRFRMADAPILDVSVPILCPELGYLHAGYSRLGVIDATRRLNAGIGLVFLLASIALLVGVRFVATKVTLPLHLLEQEVSLFPQKSLVSQSWRLRGTREIESLAKRFADMEQRLQTLERERDATQQRMIHAERLATLGELAAGLAHEIHNPLDGMQECLRYLEADAGKSARAAKYYPMLRNGLERIGGTMRAMLNFARSGQKVVIEDCSVLSVLESLALLVEVHLEGRNIRLTWGGKVACVCRCDRESLAQAGLNLVLNAAEAAEGSAAPEVRISVCCDAEWVQLLVEDSGPGVPPELHARVFEPFFTTKPMGKGTGLGLPVSRELIRAAGGELTLAPEPGSLGGAKFSIRVPKARCEGLPHGQSTCQCSHRR